MAWKEPAMPILAKSCLAKSWIVLVALTLAACAEPWPMQYSWPGEDPYEPELAFCYASLARTDCYAEPIPRQEYRQVGRGVAAPH